MTTGAPPLDENRHLGTDESNPPPASNAGNGAPIPSEGAYGADAPPADGDPGPPRISIWGNRQRSTMATVFTVIRKK